MTATTRLNLPKTIAILIFISAAIFLTSSALAIDSTTSANRREKVQERIETKKENVENRISMVKEKMASREAAMKAKLATFKNKEKAQTAERVSTNLNTINKNQTTQMQNHLIKMSELLTKLENRVNQAKPDIKDPSAAKTAIANARANIASTSAAVTAQSEKDYTITITTESKIKADAQKARDSLKTDLMTVRKLVIDAKQSVSNAIRIARGNTKLQEGTPSGQQ